VTLEIRLLKDKLEVGEEARKRVQADFETTPHESEKQVMEQQ